MGTTRPVSPDGSKTKACSQSKRVELYSESKRQGLSQRPHQGQNRQPGVAEQATATKTNATIQGKSQGPHQGQKRQPGVAKQATAMRTLEGHEVPRQARNKTTQRPWPTNQRNRRGRAQGRAEACNWSLTETTHAQRGPFVARRRRTTTRGWPDSSGIARAPSSRARARAKGPLWGQKKKKNNNKNNNN